jgi:hypothetical protein
MKLNLRKVCLVLLSLTLLLPTAFASANTGATVGVTSPAADLRVTLDRLLAEHAILAVIAMQNGIDGSGDFEASAGALLANADDLAAAIGSVYGAEAAKAFDGLWKQHIGFFVDYVVATGKKDEAGRKAALDKLGNYKKDFSAFLSSATDIEASALAAGLQMHVDQLVSAFDSYVAKDYTTTYASVRSAYAHMFMTGDALAGAITAKFPDKFTAGNTTKGSVDLRVALDRLLSEHALLAVVAMQKGIDGSADFEASAGALLANADDLAAAIGSVYGPEAAKAFDGLWKQHIGFFVDYVVATGKKDEAGKKAALDKLGNYKKDFAAFLSSATDIEAPALAAGLQMHVDQLVSAFDSYVAKDYTTTYKSIRAAYAHMFMTGDALSGAIVAKFPEMFGGKKSDDMPGTSVTIVTTLKVGSKHVDINGQMAMLDVAPFIKDGHTFISLRNLSEAVGAEVKYEAKTKTVWVITGDVKAAFWIGSDQMELNGVKKDVGAKLFIKDGRTQVPLRFIAELLDWKVEYNKADSTIKLTK